MKVPVPRKLRIVAMVIAMVVTLGATSIAQAQEIKPITTLEEWDKLLSQLSTMKEQAHKGVETGPAWARDLAAKWDLYLMSGELGTQLGTLRERAKQESAATDEAAVKRTIAEAAPLLEEQRFRGMALTGYSMSLSGIEYQLRALQAWLARATDADRSKAESVALASRQASDKSFAAAMSSPTRDPASWKALNQVARPGMDALNRLRLDLVEAQKALPNPIRLAPLARAVSCPSPVAGDAGQEKVHLAKDFPALEKYYSVYARNAAAQGRVTVRAVVSDGGCAISSEVVNTSGVWEIDLGAMNLAIEGTYVPGLKDGKPLPGEVEFQVNFELKE